MGYRTVDEFDGFDFKDAHITSMERRNGHFIAVLDDVKILPSNSCNRDIREMRTNELVLKLNDAVVEEFILEGCKIYDADGVLQEAREDTTVESSEYDKTLKEMEDRYIYEITKENDIYTIYIDGDEDSYMIKVKASHDTQEWEKFLSKE
ncbi:MAG: subtilin biosynthesis sensor protein SpaK [Lachnospiraceae bacterium]|nr:subtilin biosynthesis sensor protein SpaK [Lachnospiraceae bacterium]